ncbi:MAG: cell division protein FtsZ [bacterium]|nr:cell division protein FtsZ [bacterium]MDI1334984.1 cell division protein FtsZ [Lacunisphaera sp.]
MSLPPHELPLEALTDRDVGIKLIGIGGGGSNAVDRLKMENLDRLQLAVINTDLKALSTSPVQDKILIGTSLTRGLSAGGDPELGLKAAEADADKIAEIVKGTDLVFLVAGLGGGTGSGAAPVVAEIAAEAGAVVIAFVTLPFTFEGGRRRKQAEEALAELRRVCDAVIPLANDMLLQEGTEQTSVLDSFAQADQWIGRGVKSIWAMLSRTGLINVDFTALRQVFQHRGGKTLFGLGVGDGENPAQAALDDLKNCPLLHTPEYARKADRLLVNITGGADLSLTKVNELMTAITEEFGREAHVVMGAAIDESLQGRVEICVIGTTDLGSRNFTRREPKPATAARRPERPAGATTTSAEPDSNTNVTTTVTPESTRSNRKAPAVHAPGILQEEFGFQGPPAENRGAFDKSDRNLFEGQDLDIPTYLRKGIKVTV